ncbi:N-acyl homoserine lactonase family protein [Natronobacterium gregoryi]|uniref:Beta-lactamase n=2 Tax=Natronobacterium gregoryi TaxID=44930 RepID=L0AHA3_NATGS|nr:N-acyl homoserine lactonase family protein [Natronobacterium gregoryi]AFZ72455.1 Zn-dependent hydrolase, glyoxylase [Natronobacterium gregoryi SP2]ELY74326.1 beta-lactamase [Natronobacterium gregoryi SP2]PLK21428.1 MBL fold metallo-hydrolase [Natronobacterium gregoryi SP2]SFI78202.1 Metallo-beta-lactamase superfamily protein [Natronobacterium gregoryi]
MGVHRLYRLNTAEWTFDHSMAVQLEKPGDPYTGWCPCYLLEHPEGLVLFDTGISREMAADPAEYGPSGAAHMTAFLETLDLAVGQSPTDHLAALGYEPEDVDYVVLSHLHVDHAGNVDAFPDAEVIVQKSELRYAFWPDGVQRLFYLEGDFSPLRDESMDVTAITGEYDLFGDGSVVAFPTPGHTPGHQSLAVELESKTVVLAADVANSREGYERERVPSFVWSLEDSLESIQRVRSRARKTDATVVVHHDPDEQTKLPDPPAALE